jgi:hypothetical protein
MRRFERNQEGGEFGSVMITETGFLAGLARVKAKTLSGSGQVSRVRSGNRVKAFSLSRGDRISRLGWVQVG